MCDAVQLLSKHAVIEHQIPQLRTIEAAIRFENGGRTKLCL